MDDEDSIFLQSAQFSQPSKAQSEREKRQRCLMPQSGRRRRTLWRGTRRRWEKLAREDARADLAARLSYFSESQFLSSLALVSAAAAVHDGVAVLLAVSASTGARCASFTCKGRPVCAARILLVCCAGQRSADLYNGCAFRTSICDHNTWPRWGGTRFKLAGGCAAADGQ